MKISLALWRGQFQDEAMFAVVASKSFLDGFVLGWFDVILLVILAFGFWRGRKHGMSREFLPVTQWLLIVLVGAFTYQLLGDQLVQLGAIKAVFGTHFNQTTAAYISAYLIIAFVVFIIFSFLKRRYSEKLAGGNTFGSGEYYLGTASGIIRYLCIVFFALALLNAPFYSGADIAAQKAYNNRWFGGGLQGYSGDFIPSIAEVQNGVFKNSFTGKFIHEQLPVLLIESTGAGKPRKPGSH